MQILQLSDIFPSVKKQQEQSCSYNFWYYILELKTYIQKKAAGTQSAERHPL